MHTSEKIRSREEMVAQVGQWKASGESVVFTNGCFDLVHLGHVDYLEKAAALGDRLVIGLNTDASVSELKGPSRPIIEEQDRARLLAALGFIDGVVLFGEPTPLDLIVALTPDILVKGADYTVEEVVGAPEVQAAGGRVELIAFVDGYSTSKLIDRIKAL